MFEQKETEGTKNRLFVGNGVFIQKVKPITCGGYRSFPTLRFLRYLL